VWHKNLKFVEQKINFFLSKYSLWCLFCPSPCRPGRPQPPPPAPRYAPRTYHQISRQGMKCRRFLRPAPVKVYLCTRNRDEGSGGKAPLILNLDIRWICDHLHATAALHPRKHSLLPLNRRLGGFQSWSRRFEKDVPRTERKHDSRTSSL
jgi:hypothetical protein